MKVHLSVLIPVLGKYQETNVKKCVFLAILSTIHRIISH